MIRIIPVLLLKNGGLYKTVRFKNPNYVGDPINTVKIFNEKEADEIVLLDISASLDKKQPDYTKIAEIASEAFMPMAYGGGIRTAEDAKKVFDCGYEKVVLNSILFEKPQLVEDIARIYGSQSVVASIDVKKNFFGKNRVFSHSGSKTQDYLPPQWAKTVENYGVGEIIINAIEKDGTWCGYDLPLIEQIAHAVTIPVVACGGASSFDDFRQAIRVGASAVAAGSLFVYQKKGMGVLINFPKEKF